MNELARGVLFWLPYFLVPELLGIYWSGCPWPTLSGTIQDLIAGYPGEAGLVTLFLVALWGHFERGWSPLWLVAIGTVCAAFVGVKYVPR